jgi:hypothetical protein
MGIDQIASARLGAAAAWLSLARGAAARRWACIFGLLGQPFWFYASWTTGQWGIFTVSAIYLCAWLRGLWVYWVAPRQDAPPDSGLGTIQLTPGRRA